MGKVLATSLQQQWGSSSASGGFLGEIRHGGCSATDFGLEQRCAIHKRNGLQHNASSVLHASGDALIHVAAGPSKCVACIHVFVVVVERARLLWFCSTCVEMQALQCFEL
jgi:hypothetical protein